MNGPDLPLSNRLAINKPKAIAEQQNRNKKRTNMKKLEYFIIASSAFNIGVVRKITESKMDIMLSVM